MSYEYSDPRREGDPYALPNVEVFHVGHTRDWRDPLTCHQCNDWTQEEQTPHSEHVGYYYAFGFPGCLWDSEPVGPFDTYAEALADAREGCE